MNNIGNQVTNVNGQVVAQQQQVQAQVVNTVPVQQPVVNVQPAQNTQAMFTQEQLNSIISGRINPLNQKIQELNAQLAQAQQLSQSYLNELTCFKNRESAVKAGVPAQFVDFAVFEASKLAVNGKSFEDAMKEYVASNGSLFGVSQMNNQVQQTASPAVQQTTQGVASPAQNVQTQQVSTVNDQVAGQATNQNAVNNQVANTNVANNGIVQQTDGVSLPQTNVQYGATSVQTAGNPANVNSVDSEVDAFLKSRGLRK
jgi:hypothetical protein